jgi:hypothetical protein
VYGPKKGRTSNGIETITYMTALDMDTGMAG